MRILRNSGSERVVDLIRPWFKDGNQLEMVTPSLSLFAFAEVTDSVTDLAKAKLVLPPDDANPAFFGAEADRAARNRLQTRWLLQRFAEWIRDNVELRRAREPIPQGAIVACDGTAWPTKAVLGAFSFDTEGLGLAPHNLLSLVGVSETQDETVRLCRWFRKQWATLDDDPDAKKALVTALETLAAHRAPAEIYARILHALFVSEDANLREARVVRAASGIRDALIWRKLTDFQRDGVVDVLYKLSGFGGCILADSIGLGRMLEALATIKVYELRNGRVLVLCPKRRRETWMRYKANDRRNALASDRFRYEVLTHTDLSRTSGISGSIDLDRVAWCNYDLVVIDAAQDLRNKRTVQKGGDTRYDRLMRCILRDGVKTRVLMLSAMPVNNRLTGLRDMVAFATAGDDAALKPHGVPSIVATMHRAQSQVDRWIALDSAARTPSRLLSMLDLDTFRVFDWLTVARKRHHIEIRYGTTKANAFPKRLPPVTLKPEVDLQGKFPPLCEVADDIRQLYLAAYTPLRYVLPSQQAAYDKAYSTEIHGGTGYFRQVDREESLAHLLRMEMLKRLESAPATFAVMVKHQLTDVETMLSRIASESATFDEMPIAGVEIDAPDFERLQVTRNVAVRSQDLDLIRWKTELIKDRNRLEALLVTAHLVSPDRDGKLAQVRKIIEKKCRKSITPHNRKAIIFTAFATTAQYLYAQIAPWAKQTLGVASALVTGSARPETTLSNLPKDLGAILSAFAPYATARPDAFAPEGGLDLLIATDGVLEGVDLQDCDCVINYDIQWDPARVVRRLGCIDRAGSPNKRIQMVNVWPNLALPEYLRLAERVSGRIVMLELPATGRETLIERQSADVLDDWATRRRQLDKLQRTVIDLEDTADGISLTDFTFTDLRTDLAAYLKAHPDFPLTLPPGAHAVMRQPDAATPPGIIFCLQAATDAAIQALGPDDLLAPHVLVYVASDGTVVHPHTQPKLLLDRLKCLCQGCHRPDRGACACCDSATGDGEDMQAARSLLEAAVTSITGNNQQQAVASLFQRVGAYATPGADVEVNDFEVVAFLVILPMGA